MMGTDSSVFISTKFFIFCREIYSFSPGCQMRISHYTYRLILGKGDFGLENSNHPVPLYYFVFFFFIFLLQPLIIIFQEPAFIGKKSSVTFLIVICVCKREKERYKLAQSKIHLIEIFIFVDGFS